MKANQADESTKAKRKPHMFTFINGVEQFRCLSYRLDFVWSCCLMKLKHRLRAVADSAGASSVVWAQIRSERLDVDADCAAIKPGSGAA